MNNVIQVEAKSVYGIEKLYPVNSLAEQLASFKGQKTLTHRDVLSLKDMGFSVEQVVVPVGKLVGIKIADL